MVALLNATLIASVATATGVYTDEHTTGPSDSGMPVCLCVCVCMFPTKCVARFMTPSKGVHALV